MMWLLITVAGMTQNYTPVDEGSKVHFVIKNFGINTGGDFSGLKGTVTFNPGNLKTSVMNVSVAVKTIDTDNETRDGHLRSDSYFDAEKFPLITITSTKIDKNNKSGSYYFTGTLTMHGVTKIISFPFTATLQDNDYLFTGKFDLNRLDYGVGEPSSILSKTVKVSILVLAKKR
jgi:Uncharacterized conserved protein